MLKKLPGGVALALALLPLSAHAAPTASVNAFPDDVGGARVGTMYTTWDDYYFYAAFRVHDANVVGTNSGTTAQPQQDDDVEVFFETDDARAKVRTPQTFQMAVSADEGAYFSVGDNTKIPKGKAVYSYKYAVVVHGTRNKPDDTDQGYDVEMAIPWSEMGRTGPPAPGSTWGFNVISRDRQSPTDPADSFYSLSPKVRKREDVQNPSRWSRITFAAAGAGLVSTEDKVVCAQGPGRRHVPPHQRDHRQRRLARRHAAVVRDGSCQGRRAFDGRGAEHDGVAVRQPGHQGGDQRDAGPPATGLRHHRHH